MSLKFDRNFKNGRQSEQFLNDELITLYETLRYLPHHKKDPDHFGEMPPSAKIDGALNAQIPGTNVEDSSLNYWDQAKQRWLPFFAKKFQITDHILMERETDTPVPGQLWINNGVMCYFTGKEWRPIRAINMDDSQWSSAAFADYQIVSPLNQVHETTVEVNGLEYVIDESVAKDEAVDRYWRYNYNNELDYESRNTVLETDDPWHPEWFSPMLPEPAQLVISDAMRAQYCLPNLRTDRVFLNNSLDESYTEISSISFEYPLKQVIDKTISGIHLNPGKLTKIRKRLVKIDKLNSTIAISPYHTEFYGFRRGEVGGRFLIPSETQDKGDYVTAGDHIILNYTANQNYDYILAITYEFSWMRSDGVMDKKGLHDITSSFYLSNLRAPLNLHVNGLKLEEADYDINLFNNTVTIHESAEDVIVNAWTPYKKQFGYIRETDLRNRGIIRLREMVHVPLVFVGGTLIHPLYSGLEFDGDKIYVPNSGGLNQMKNMQWCVVDLVSDDRDLQMAQYGSVSSTSGELVPGMIDHFEEPDTLYLNGMTSPQPDENGIYEYVLASGIVRQNEEMIIRYDNTRIGPDDGIILFVEGLMINRDDIIRHHEEGYLTIENTILRDGQQYVLLKDIDGAIYNSSNMLPAFSIGYLSDSLVYLNGLLLAEPNCVMTLDNPETEIKNGVVDQEIRQFITNDMTGEGFWKIFNQYTGQWDDLEERDAEAVPEITYAYENQLTSVKINVPYERHQDSLAIFSFKFANDITGILSVGTASYSGFDEETGYPVYKIDGFYESGRGCLNVYRNGVKLIYGKDYEEMTLGTSFYMKTEAEETDIIQYMVEPVEHGYTSGHVQVVMSRSEAVRRNIYKVPDELPVSLYPGRLTVYINGIRIPETDWTLLSDRSILLNYQDYAAVGSDNNYPEESFLDDKYTKIDIHHATPDEILVEIRYDYERHEKTIYWPKGRQLNDLHIDEFELDEHILESSDEILFYLNGQFAGLSRSKDNDYRLDRYRGCISFMEPDFIEAASSDELKKIFDENNYVYTAWKKEARKGEYESDRENALTIVWR